MPMEATPLEQEVVADATNETDQETVAPFVGLVTVTPANAAGAQIANRHTSNIRHFSMQSLSNRYLVFDLLELQSCLVRERAQADS